MAQVYDCFDYCGDCTVPGESGGTCGAEICNECGCCILYTSEELEDCSECTAADCVAKVCEAAQNILDCTQFCTITCRTGPGPSAPPIGAPWSGRAPTPAEAICAAMKIVKARNSGGCQFDTETSTSSDPDLCNHLVNCLFDLYAANCGGVPSTEEIEKVLGCGGCGDGYECIPAAGDTPAYPDPFGDDRTFCDMNDDGATDLSDWDEFYDAAVECNEDPLDDDEKLALLCKFLNDCAPHVDHADLCELGAGAFHHTFPSFDSTLVAAFEACWSTKPSGCGDEIRDPRCCEPQGGHPGGGGGGGSGGNPNQLQSQTDGSEGCGGNDAGPAGVTSLPVDIAYGYKTEMVTDLVVSLPGTDYALTRFYRSNAQVEGNQDPGLVGQSWSLTDFTYLMEENASDPCASGATRHPIIVTPNRSLEYSAYSSGKWSSPGATPDYFEEVTVTDEGDDLVGGTLADAAMWRHTNPGLSVCEYYRSGCGNSENERTGFVGLLRSMSDAHGNRWLYLYTTVDSVPRLDKIEFQRVGTSGLETVAEASFTWEADPDSLNVGRLLSVEIVRSSTTVESCEYLYKDVDDGISDAVGTPGDLIQVTRRTTLDNGSDDRVQITQYRYHSAGMNEINGYDADGDTFAEQGSDHQLKAVITPEQVEYHAQQLLSEAVDAGGTYWTTAPTDLEETAANLLTLGDGDYFNQAGTSTLAYRVINLASKVVSKYEVGSGINGRVLRQYVQSTCGCGGAGSVGTRFDYEYFAHTTGDYTATTVVHEAQLTNPSTVGSPGTELEFAL